MIKDNAVASRANVTTTAQPVVGVVFEFSKLVYVKLTDTSKYTNGGLKRHYLLLTLYRSKFPDLPAPEQWELKDNNSPQYTFDFEKLIQQFQLTLSKFEISAPNQVLIQAAKSTLEKINGLFCSLAKGTIGAYRNSSGILQHHLLSNSSES